MTAELAVTLPALTAVLALLLLAAMLGVTQLRLEEAARSAARSFARGDSVATAFAAARQVAGGTAEISVSMDENLVYVQVTARLSGPMSAMVNWPLTATATAGRESAPQSARAYSAQSGHSP
ncbi:pilus assembly protein TadE [Paenarthrobacter sp. Z7-10]|uniref:TadE family type IV pilus minor pilin n=1 Tax=Paenarthrobacter sp. Z7-10 TaxID=2787635 RepID=UPI0022A90E3C|nr:TadE family type IV pilus minor pilin [Paenarthrobacter sp. Z7-10]MCZ2401797.1 pilus assembly protein TadE [Paenarthrobacter sp. Z7-10]